jgi:hypothetical protein
MDDQDDLSRRDALAKLGKFAAYTAPAMMVLLTSEKAMARSNAEGEGGTSGGHQDGKGGGNDPGPGGRPGTIPDKNGKRRGSNVRKHEP